MKTIPVTTVRQNIYKILEQIMVSNEPIQITSKKRKCSLNFRRRLECYSRNAIFVVSTKFKRKHHRVR